MSQAAVLGTSSAMSSCAPRRFRAIHRVAARTRVARAPWCCRVDARLADHNTITCPAGDPDAGRGQRSTRRCVGEHGAGVRFGR